MNMYCVEIKGVYNDIYSYVKYPSVIQLAYYLNDRVARYPREPILAVYLTENYEDKGQRILLQTEYNQQYFYETYEKRLIEQYRLENLAV